jgi:hypothetical protein
MAVSFTHVVSQQNSPAAQLASDVQLVFTPQVPPPQKPLVHWSFAVHGLPFARLATQLGAAQKSVAMQSASAAQVVLHAVAPHAYGEQAVCVPATQLPLPLHVPALVCDPFEHDGGTHCVPEG